MKTRLNKYLSEQGFCSRREADRLIDEGRITVNGSLPEMGSKVDLNDIILINNEPLKKAVDHVYLLFHKPVGIVSTTDQTIKANMIDYINYPRRIFHVGRLDKDSEGLIIMTSDGDIVNKILRSENNHEKEYIVRVNKPVTKDFISGMENGVPILDKVTKKCKVKQINVNTFSIILTEGMNRQIRRMCSYFDYDVVRLKRTRIMDLKLDIPVGKYRELTKEERHLLFERIGHKEK